MKSVPLIVQDTVEFTASLPFSQQSRLQRRLDCGAYRGWQRCALVARPPRKEQGRLWGERAEASALPAETASRRLPSGCAPALLRQDAQSLLRQPPELPPRPPPAPFLPPRFCSCLRPAYA